MFVHLSIARAVLCNTSTEERVTMNTDYQTQSASTATMTVYQATILKPFAELEKTAHVPALELPGLDVATTARGFGCRAVTAHTAEEIRAAFAATIRRVGPSLIAIPILRENLPLVPAAVDLALSRPC
jgi:thiamine pyrophosphate-dependent acetolactate synthase large subunit-like protein